MRTPLALWNRPQVETLEQRRLLVAYTWLAPVSGDWFVPGNWMPFGVPGPGDTATIDAPGDYTVVMMADPMIDGLELGGGTPGIKTLDVFSPFTIDGPAAMGAMGTLDIDVDGLMNMMPAGGINLLNTSTLFLADGATLDLFDNDMIVDYAFPSLLPFIEDWISDARDGGTWDEPGITSSFAEFNPMGNTTLGAMEATDYAMLYGPAFPFAGVDPDGTAILVKYTYYGDRDYNGFVDGDDYAYADFGFGTSASGWLNGDGDLNGFNDADDYALLDLSFLTQTGVL
jgi:hypothetical protein